jgi:quercetin dioxygenase-like cupin family protein
MAFQNKIITNPVTGQTIRFLQTSKDTSGELLEMEACYRSHSKVPPLHYHPYQDEDFIIEKGQMTVRMQGKVFILKKGDRLHIPANVSHTMWNNSDNNAIVNWKVRPAIDTEYFLETITGLAAGKKANPSFLQMVLTARKYFNVFRLSSPAFIIQKILFIVLIPFALLAGYKSVYKKYLD